ncbi:serine/threonine protein kinase [Actinoplanes sp. TBRC 11911]|uniref:serine/threonine-protein kinase n=1 Tax=Actinoplanes sp. TBRC 11911 TaxID=2729386 RepID=UPI00145E783B|nr:serine/threonine-protein kinase [Actinoplanes sp. TBRC 11911]NMO57421.1 serine/threonine protein kinase [Actinoplanes sp. TBRC 11911]
MAVRRMLVAGRYRLHEVVGTGGMGRVWLARDEMLDRDVAVKEFVPPEWMTDAEKERLRDRTLREARSAGRLNHPHVVRVFDVVHEDNQPWIVMEYVPSRSLHQVIHDDGPYSPAAAARIGLAVLDALTAAHRAGVLHRDIKPHNVLIGHDGRVVLTDFGLATFVDDGSVTGPGLVVGSPQYVSPERARDGASTVESDLWSFGATLYAAVEGRSPYARETAMATLMALATEPPDPPEKAGLLGPVLTGLLRHDPHVRLTASEVDRRLRMIVAATPGVVTIPAQRRGGSSVVAVATPPPPPPGPPPPPDDPPPPLHHRPRVVVASLATVAVLGAGGVLAGYLAKSGGEPTADKPTSRATMITAGFSPATCDGPGPSLAPRLPQRDAARGVNGWELIRGWSYFADGTGFHIPVPDGWTWQKIGSTYCFRDPAGGRVLSLDTGRDPKGDPVTACEREEKRLVAAGALPQYQRIGIEAKPLLEKAADWDYSYADASGLGLRARTRWFAMNGKAYALSWATRDIDWPSDLAKISMVLSSFYTDSVRPTHS